MLLKGASPSPQPENLGHHLRVLRLGDPTPSFVTRSIRESYLDNTCGSQSKTALVHEGGRWGVPQGDEIIRTHQEDLCQALGVPPARKYQNEGGPRPEDIIDLLRTVSSSPAAEESVRSFVDALAWNWLIGGTDAHAKNYSLLLAGGAVVLAPLYDVASSLPYFDVQKMRLAMKLGAFYEMQPYGNPFSKVAADLQVDLEWFVSRARELAKGAGQAMAEAAAAESVKALGRALPRSL